MGVCGSKPQGCVGMKGRLKMQDKRKKHRRRMKKPHSSNNRNRVEPSNRKDLSYSNPAFQGNSESWFDPDAVIDSDGDGDDDDEFFSVQDDISQAGSLSNVVTPRFSSQVLHNNAIDSHLNSDDPQIEVKNSVEKSSAQCEHEQHSGRNENGALHSCGFISNALLPCLACDESLEGKRKLPSVGGPSTRKRLSIGSSFKWKEGQENPILSSVKAIIRRPIAGSQIMCSPLEKKMPESWSRVEPNTFKVRGRNYTRDKKKEFAPHSAAYVPFGVDVFLSPCKIDHVARFVELPAIDSHGEVPPILVVNLQIPLYPAALFQNE
ncbi:hypothetical protein CDL12_22016 [Handroanthus impetiginosus]|uniref:Protein ENHANCED DISEASE RESISTANCE 2 C-terminal domain-containing protein n=1 Tax=Handroanthus impetiginosus TaxID=429701 RepID=A0A2G9GJK8_9LAMI|nr:hypothetical protein CDL12_22016 [Handroanthus impetiginosus]